MSAVEYSFGNWIKHRRKALDLTQHELAKRVGCSVSLIFKIESDERRPSHQIAELLAATLEIPPDERELFLKVARQKRGIQNLDSISSLSGNLPVSIPYPIKMQLPALLTALVGRQNEMQMIIQQLHDPACRLLTLTGPGGVGKTRLALEVAHQIRDQFSHGVCFVSLVGTSASEFIVPSIAEALGFVFFVIQEPKVQLFSFLHEKQLLLVLDNLEHLLDGIELLNQLLESAPHVKLLTTSRERLNLHPEWTFEVQGLPVPSIAEFESPVLNSAVELFLQRARQIEMNFTLLPEDAQALVRICQLVDGLPLGLELAATWVRTLSCHEIAQEIEKSVDFLTRTARDVPPRHRSIRAVFDYSWCLLTPDEQQVLMRLSVFRGGFTLNAAMQVAGATLPIISALVDKSLLRRSENSRYDLHELIRQYCEDQLVKSGKFEEVRELHLEYFLHLAEESRSKLRGPEQFTWFSILEKDHDNLRAALEWALRNNTSATEIHLSNAVNVQRSLRLVSALYTFWAIRTHWSAGRKWLGRALAQSSRIPPMPELADALSAAALLAMNQADLQSARRFAEQNLALAQQIEHPYTKAQALFTFGTVLWKQKDFAAARNYCQQALAQFRELRMKVEMAESLHILNIIGLSQRDFEGVQPQAEEVLAISHELEDQWMISLAWSDMGTLAYLRNDFKAARSYLEKTLQLSREVGGIVGVAKMLDRLGDISRCESEYEKAEKCYAESLKLYREAGDNEGIASALHNLGYVTKHFRDYHRAMALFRKGLAMHAEIRNEAGIAECLVGIAAVLSTQGQIERATRLFGAAEALRERLGSAFWPANRMEHDSSLAYLRESMKEVSFAENWAMGKSMSAEQAIAEVEQLHPIG